MFRLRVLPRTGRAAISLNAPRHHAPWAVATRPPTGQVRFQGSTNKANIEAWKEATRQAREKRRALDHPSESTSNDIVQAGRSNVPTQTAEQSATKGKKWGTTYRAKNIPGVPDDIFRELMRHLPHPIVVVTSVEIPWKLEAEAKDTGRGIGPEPQPRAMTASSLVSITVKPHPQIMFNITLPSTTYKAIKDCGRFNVHVLRDTPRAAEIAKHFSKPQSAHTMDQAAQFGITVTPDRDTMLENYQKMETTAKRNGFVPIRQWMIPRMISPDIMYVLECQVRLKPVLSAENDSPIVPGGLLQVGKSSALVIGIVKKVIPGPATKSEDMALIYAQRTFLRAQELPTSTEEMPAGGSPTGAVSTGEETSQERT